MGKVVVAGPTIAAGQSLSDAVDCTAGQPVAIIMPLLWTPAALTFQVSYDGVAFRDLYDHNLREYRIKPIPNVTIVLPVSESEAGAYRAPPLPSGMHFRFRSGTATVPVIQEAQRQFSVTLETAAAATQQPA